MSQTKRSTLRIEIAVKENESDVTDEELRLCVSALSALVRFYQGDLEKLTRMVIEKKPEPQLQLQAKFMRDRLERLFDSRKKPPEEFLGEGNIPWSEEGKQRLKWAKNIYKRATGESQ